MKVHIGGDAASMVVHIPTGSAANVADIPRMAAVLHGQEEATFADTGYTGAEKQPEHLNRNLPSFRQGQALENRNQAQRHQGIARTTVALGEAGGEDAIEGANLDRAPVPHRQEPVRP
jgi:hypothetical protein